MQYLLVAIGGAMGAMGRYSVYHLALKLEAHAATATLTVNTLGSFIIGLMFVLLTEKSGLPPQMQSLISVGILGAFTTYSTYSLDALRMFENGQGMMALAYLLGTMLICVFSVWLGVTLGRAIF